MEETAQGRTEELMARKDTSKMVSIAVEMGRVAIEPLIMRRTDPTLVCGALAYLMGVVIYRAQGQLDKATNEEGMKAICNLIKYGYESAKVVYKDG
jgi:hypothetical protein